jgi:energy-coupling factor transporter ATP-binding protein EcfA2
MFLVMNYLRGMILRDNIEFINNIELKNYKGYRQTQNGEPRVFDLNADLILITGKNGVGKTTLLEALDWVLNHPDTNNGDAITSGEESGFIRINGEEFPVNGRGSVDRNSLNTVSSFFYQENVKALACNEVIQLLEPQSKPSVQIKQGLKDLQQELGSWQNKLNTLKYKKDYEKDRKFLAGKISEIVEQLPDKSEIKLRLKKRTFIISNGNLSSGWVSQVNNLAKSIGEVSNRVEPVGAKLAEKFIHIGTSLLEFKKPKQDSLGIDEKSVHLNQKLLESLKFLPVNFFFKRQSEAESGELGESSCLKYITPTKSAELNGQLTSIGNVNGYSSHINKLEKKQDELRKNYRYLSEQKIILSDENSSVIDWIDSFKGNIDKWLHAWDNHSDKENVSSIQRKLKTELNELKTLSVKRNDEVKIELSSIESKGKEVSEELNLLVLAFNVLRDIEQNSQQLLPLLEKEFFSLNELREFVENLLTQSQVKDVNEVSNEVKLIEGLGYTFHKWAELEKEKEYDEKNATDLDKLDVVESIISSASIICKSEASSKSQFLSLISTIPKVELKLLVENMNQLLASFHFPDDFLPITLDNDGRGANWGFRTNSDVKFDDLSTGQKSQLAICWTINLNLVLTKRLGHKVIGFDDFTTSLDMNQMIPASVLLRKLAYANDSDAAKRQVIITSHHEDLTNRLLDFLLPPDGKTMKVIQFEDWSVNNGPSYKCYDVDMKKLNQDGLESAIKGAMSTDY